MSKSVLITDLTRMQGNKICLAGIDIEDPSRSFIRPVTSSSCPLTNNLLTGHGGSIALGTIIHLKNYFYQGDNPEIEDWHFDISASSFSSISNYKTFWEYLRLSCKSRIQDFIGEGLFLQNQSFILPKGEGIGSLAKILTTISPNNITVSSYNNKISLKLNIRISNNRLSLAITDARFYKLDKGAWVLDLDSVERFKNLLKPNRIVILCLGLTRPWSTGNPPNHHWLQVNGIHPMDMSNFNW